MLPTIPLAILAQLAGTATQQNADFIYYDYLENGVLKGGRIAVVAGDPMLGQVGTLGPATESASTTILNHGPSNNRIDLVLVGDGYTSAELGTYAAQCQTLVDDFFLQTPLAQYKSFFNVHRVDVISVESGVDNDPVQGISKNTALDMGFWCGGIERALCVNVNKALTQANSAPAVDQTLALANSFMYGGVGYPSSDLGTLAAANGAALEIALHEFGHSHANLADEYDYGGPANWSGGEPSTANVSTFTASTMSSSLAKWYRWLATPGVNTFEGANYSQFGIFRPTNNSKMRSLGQPFGPVNIEQFILYFYRKVDPIDAATPPGSYGVNTTLVVDPVDPIGHSLSVSWTLDGAPITGATGTSLDVATLGLSLGAHTISVTVVDATPLVKDESQRAIWMTESRSWNIDNVGQVASYCTGKLNSDGCVPAIGSSGPPSVGSSLPFVVTCSQVVGNKLGLLFYGFAPKNVPWSGGTLCVQGPLKRTATQNSGGAPSPSLCTGNFAYDFNARIDSGVDAQLSTGANVYCQWWYRDPSTPSTTGMSNGLSFLIAP